MKTSFFYALWENFLGKSPNWFKILLTLFLVINPIFFFINPFFSGWLLVIEFIFTLAMALKCYPLLPGGLLAIEAIFIGMTTTKHVYKELIENFEVLLLLMFMVAGIYFIRQLLLFIFTQLLLKIRVKSILSLTFCFTTAFLSAFLDALTVIAVVISVAVSFYDIYHQVILKPISNHNTKQNNGHLRLQNRLVLEKFCFFLRDLVMHAAIGTAIGGVMTIVGEPQNLIIAHASNWNFKEFFLRIVPVSFPVFFCGLSTCWLVEKFQWFGYGTELPTQARKILEEIDNNNRHKLTYRNKVQLIVQGMIVIWLIIALAFHLAEVGLIGLSVIIFTTIFTGITDEKEIGKAFTIALPFAALMTVFFSIVSIVIEQKLFIPIIKYILKVSPSAQLSLFYLFSGILSSISDNVFVGTVYINEVKSAFEHSIINLKQFELLSVAINAGTNLPSVATPNGQAAFLFLLTSTLSPLIQLSYSRMVWMALPYTIILTMIGFLCVKITLTPFTEWLIQLGIINSH